eukprot:m.482631 g.482631  ORF g.482631 m.482631 type:complete len:750 (+) comp22620_c0_seq1:100-2349(+)
MAAVLRRWRGLSSLAGALRSGRIGAAATASHDSACRRTAPLVSPAQATQQRGYNIGSGMYAGAFGRFPPVDTERLREDTLVYLATFDSARWHDDPVQSLVNGKPLPHGKEVATQDAFNTDNGKQILASDEALETLANHLRSYTSSARDLRKPFRAIERTLLTTHAGELIGNQAVDFHKQDGITEIEESLEANVIEHGLNDQLLHSENHGVLDIGREVAFVGCVSNFSNFLDLCRKVLRNVELGVPVLILSRSNTTQHMYRWTQLLLSLMEEQSLDLGLVTYASCSIEQQQYLMDQAPNSPLYLTGSREVAKAIKERLPKTFASTGGPNTMVATEITPKVAEAIRNSTLIENSGQCTAMRHLVTPACEASDIEAIFAEENVDMIQSSVDSIRTKGFAGLHQGWADSQHKLSDPGFVSHSGSLPISFSVDSSLPEDIEEHWRRVFLDVTTTGSAETLQSSEYLNKLAAWLNQEQPISLAVNGDNADEGYPIMRKLFEATGLAVYTVGTPEAPCLTAQARPQDGELFGEFPPRRQLTKYTKFPVVVPTSTPGYNTTYNKSHLVSTSSQVELVGEQFQPLLNAAQPETAGYVCILRAYLTAACGPRRGFGLRSCLWGLQRPPLNGLSVVRCGSGVQRPVDSTVPSIYLFGSTNARDQYTVSVAPEHKELISLLEGARVPHSVASDEDFAAEVDTPESDVWNIIHSEDQTEFNLVGHFTSLHFPLGHIKSTKSADKHFLDHFCQSAKWLKHHDA